MESFDEWVSGCDSEPSSKWIEFIQKWSYLTSLVIKLGLTALFLQFTLLAIPDGFGNADSLNISARFFAIYSLCFYMMLQIASFASQHVEMSIDSISEVSYLKLNKGDEALISKIRNNRFKNLMRFLFGCGVTVTLGVLSSKLALIV